MAVVYLVDTLESSETTYIYLNPFFRWVLVFCVRKPWIMFIKWKYSNSMQQFSKSMGKFIFIHFEYKMKYYSEFHSSNQGLCLIAWETSTSKSSVNLQKHNITRNMMLFTGLFPFCRNCGCRKPHQTIQFGTKSQITRFCILRLDGHNSKHVSRNNICRDWMEYSKHTQNQRYKV